MFLHKHTVRMQESDATGCLYFLNQIQIAMEAFENFLQARNFSIAFMLKEKKFTLPVVHTEADFFSPLQIGDELEVKLDLIFGKKSFTCQTEFFCRGEKVGIVSTIHATVSLETNQAIEIPQELLEQLRGVL